MSFSSHVKKLVYQNGSAIIMQFNTAAANF